MIQNSNPQTLIFRPNATSTTQTAHKFGNFQHSRALKPLRKPNSSGNDGNEVENIAPVSPQRVLNPGSPLAAHLIITATPENRKSQFVSEAVAPMPRHDVDSHTAATVVKARLSLESLLKQEALQSQVTKKTLSSDESVCNSRAEQAVPGIVPDELLDTPGKKTESSIKSSGSSPNWPKGRRWMSHFPLPHNKPFEVIVQYIDLASANKVWVMHAENLVESEKLLREINDPKNGLKDLPIAMDDVKDGEVFAARFEDGEYLFLNNLNLSP